MYIHNITKFIQFVMRIAHQRALLANQRDELTARWAEKKISLHEFSSGIQIISMSLHLLDTLAGAPELVTDYGECSSKSGVSNPSEVEDPIILGQNMSSSN